MKKLLIVVMALTLALAAGPAFAKGKKAKKVAQKTWQCDVGGNVVMTGSVEECMKQGGTVTNYPGPDKAAPVKGKKAKKAMKAAPKAPKAPKAAAPKAPKAAAPAPAAQ